MIDLDARYRTVRRVTLVGATLDVALGLAKIAGGWWAQSQALVADGVHSLSDFATDMLVIYAAKHAHAAADEEHPYGHGRIETMASAVLGAVLIAVGVGIAWHAVENLLEPGALGAPGALALWIAAASVATKEALYHYTMHFARRFRSPLLRANAWHTRSDAASSIVVIIGVAGTMAGFPYLDAVAAAVVAWMIAAIGFKLAKSGAQELIDTGLDEQHLSEIRDLILEVDGVAGLHQLRTRRMAGRTLVDVHVILGEPRLSLSEGHQIGETVRTRLIRVLDDIEDVTVHVDPEDDDANPPAGGLALRSAVVQRLTRSWAGLAAVGHIKRVNLHYLQGRIHVEVEVSLSALTDASATELEAAFSSRVREEPDIADVRLLFS